jgi:hypothetical protein
VDKKPLIGLSICAVVLLVLGSLSNVVGYQSVKSTVNDSPLFNVRTQRATNQQKNIIISQYLGIGKGNLLQFPIKDAKTEALKNAIEFINKMNDKTFHRFVEKIKTLISQKENTKDIDFNDIENILHQLRKNSEVFLIYIDGNSESRTLFETPSVCWFPGCIIGAILILMMVIFIMVFVPTEMVQCWFPSIDICQ